MTFPNKAGDHADTDDVLRAELRAAGIQTLQEVGVLGAVERKTGLGDCHLQRLASQPEKRSLREKEKILR